MSDTKHFLFFNIYLWRIHFNIWQNQYNIVKIKNKIKLEEKKKKEIKTAEFLVRKRIPEIEPAECVFS